MPVLRSPHNFLHYPEESFPLPPSTLGGRSSPSSDFSAALSPSPSPSSSPRRSHLFQYSTLDPSFSSPVIHSPPPSASLTHFLRTSLPSGDLYKNALPTLNSTTLLPKNQQQQRSWNDNQRALPLHLRNRVAPATQPPPQSKIIPRSSQWTSPPVPYLHHNYPIVRSIEIGRSSAVDEDYFLKAGRTLYRTPPPPPPAVSHYNSGVVGLQSNGMVCNGPVHQSLPSPPSPLHDTNPSPLPWLPSPRHPPPPHPPHSPHPHPPHPHPPHPHTPPPSPPHLPSQSPHSKTIPYHPSLRPSHVNSFSTSQPVPLRPYYYLENPSTSSSTSSSSSSSLSIITNPSNFNGHENLYFNKIQKWGSLTSLGPIETLCPSSSAEALRETVKRWQEGVKAAATEEGEKGWRYMKRGASTVDTTSLGSEGVEATTAVAALGVMSNENGGRYHNPPADFSSCYSPTTLSTLLSLSSVSPLPISATPEERVDRDREYEKLKIWEGLENRLERYERSRDMQGWVRVIREDMVRLLKDVTGVRVAGVVRRGEWEERVGRLEREVEAGRRRGEGKGKEKRLRLGWLERSVVEKWRLERKDEEENGEAEMPGGREKEKIGKIFWECFWAAKRADWKAGT